MTQMEQERVDALIEKVRLLGALRWTEGVQPDVQPPTKWGDCSEGWTYNACFSSLESGRVYKAWSDSTSHGTGEPPRDRRSRLLASKESKNLYSTRLLALKALRHTMELKAAEALARVDAMIEAEMSNPDPPKEGE